MCASPAVTAADSKVLPPAALTPSVLHLLQLPSLQPHDSCISCTPFFNPVPAFTWFRHLTTYHTIMGVDEDINKLFLLAPSTDDVDHMLYYYPWEKKRNKLFFRGGAFCHEPEAIREDLATARWVGDGVLRDQRLTGFSFLQFNNDTESELDPTRPHFTCQQQRFAPPELTTCPAPHPPRLCLQEYGLTEWENCARIFFYERKLYKQYATMADCQRRDGQKDGRAVHANYEPRRAAQRRASSLAPTR